MLQINRKIIGLTVLVMVAYCGCTNSTPTQTTAQNSQGNVIFIHPDGTSASHWGAARMLNYGPDGRLNWDKMSNLGVYLGHLKNQLTATSNAGAVIHATGVKVNDDSFGLDENGQPIVAASGKPQTIMQEAVESR